MSLIADLLRRFAPGAGAARGAPDDTRWVVVDCESSGLDPHSDRLISIGAIGVRSGSIVLGDAYSVLLRQPEVSATDNILVHGIGHAAQLSGESPAEALTDFDAFVGDSPLAGFHTPFDQVLLERAFRSAAGRAWRRQWLDLAALAPSLFPALARRCTALDHWLEAFAIQHPARHDALGDAYATAQLFLVLLEAARGQGLARVRNIFAAAKNARWLPQ